MLKLRNSSPIGGARQYLSLTQSQIDAIANYADRVIEADEKWGAKKSATFSVLRALLELTSVGSRRCHYCEDSAADEIEHIWPKKFYPEKTFVWSNYLFACGPCNGSNKNDQCAVFDTAGVVQDIIRKKGAPITPPITGNPVFLDPSNVDPMSFMELDLTTGIFIPMGNPNSIGYKRAEYTIRVLGLNKRDYLSNARRNAHGSYVDSLKQYIEDKRNNVPPDVLKKKRMEIAERHHPSVWFEIKRLAQQSIEYHQYFAQAPELYLV